MPLRREATIHADGPVGRPWWLSHSTWSLAVPPSSAGGDQNDIHPMRRGGAKSFVDDLVLGRGVVLSRAATSLRSIETQPWTRRFVRYRRRTHLRGWSEVRVSKNICQQIFSKFVGLFSTPLSFSPVCKGLARRDGVFIRGEGLFSTYCVPSPDGT